MEKVELPLSQLTLAQKLDLMETIWDEIAKNENELKSPAWHEEVLRDREKALASSKASVSDWEEAKNRIKQNGTTYGTSCRTCLSINVRTISKKYHVAVAISLEQ